MERELTIPKWLAKKNNIPEVVRGEILAETEKAKLISVSNCSEVCTPYKEFREEVDEDEEYWGAHPCDGCLRRLNKNHEVVAWIPKSQVLEEKIYIEPTPKGITNRSPF